MKSVALLSICSWPFGWWGAESSVPDTRTQRVLTPGRWVQLPVRLTVGGVVVWGGCSDGAESPCSRHHGGRGSCCHCQILSRAVGCKQQMVELVPEQRVKPRQPAVWLSWNNLCSSVGSGVFLGSRGFCVRITVLVSRRWACSASFVLSNKEGSLGAALRLYCAYSLCSIRGSYQHRSEKVFKSLICH